MEDPGRGPTRGGSPEMEAIFIKIVIREKKNFHLQMSIENLVNFKISLL